MDYGWGVVMPVMKQQKIKYAATQHKQSSHRGAGGLWGLFSANIFVSDSDGIIHQKETKLHDLGFGATFYRAWRSSRYKGVCIMYNNDGRYFTFYITSK